MRSQARKPKIASEIELSLRAEIEELTRSRENLERQLQQLTAYLTSDEWECYVTDLLTTFFMIPLSEWSKKHPEINDKESRHVEGINLSLEYIIKMLTHIRDHYELIPRIGTQRPCVGGQIIHEEKKR